MADNLGYRPDPMLSSLAAYRRSRQQATIHSTVAWLNQWPDPRELRRWHEFDSYWKGAFSAAEQLGYRLEEFIVNAEISADRLQAILSARGVRGILIPPHSHSLSLPGFDWSQFSVVRLGLSVREPRAHVITSDQMNCAAMAFERIHQRGFRRIGFITSRRFDQNTGGNFRAGYLSAQNTHLSPRRHLAPLMLEEQSAAADLRDLRRWLQRTSPDAIVTSMPALHRLLTRLGVRVPGQLSVAALSVLDGDFDAGVDQNSVEIGRVALRTLASLIHQNERGIPESVRRILVEGRWIEGSSVATVPPAGAAPRAPKVKRSR